MVFGSILVPGGVSYSHDSKGQVENTTNTGKVQRWRGMPRHSSTVGEKGVELPTPRPKPGCGDQSSSLSSVSSMVISLNSLDSNTSPHSRHSTNSESSSRDTMRTRGCLHSAMLLLFSGTEDGGIGFINPAFAPARAGQVNIAGRLAAF